MGTTTAIVVEEVRRRLASDGKRLSDTIDADIEAAIPAALQLVGMATANSPNPRYRSYAQDDFTFAMVSGEADLSGTPEMLLDHVVRVTHDTTGVLSHAKTVDYLTSEKLPMGGGWYSIEAGILKAKLDDGETDPPDGNVTARAGSIPTLANLHDQLLDDLIAALIELLSGGAAQAA